MGRWFERLEEGLIAFLLAAMTIVTFVQVIARYVFNYSFVWSLELVTILFAWLIFLGMCYGVRMGSHIGVDALVRTLGPRAALLAGFVLSGLVHDLVISWPAGGGYGGPTVYFTVQGLAILGERSTIGRRLRLGRGWRGRTFTAATLALPLPLLFHLPFVTRVVVPFMDALGAS
jgi:hypothetical protein